MARTNIRYVLWDMLSKFHDEHSVLRSSNKKTIKGLQIIVILSGKKTLWINICYFLRNLYLKIEIFHFASVVRRVCFWRFDGTLKLSSVEANCNQRVTCGEVNI